MFKLIFKLFCGSLILLVMGCAALTPTSEGKNFPTENLNTIKIGVPKALIIELLGSPHETEGVSSEGIYFEEFKYFYGKGSTSRGTKFRSRGLDIEFVGDSVNAYLFHSSFSEDNTDFDFDGRKRLKLDESNKEDVRNVLGEPSGMAHLPTASISEEIIEAHETAKEMWRYIYIIHERQSKGRLKGYVKQIAIFFDDKGIAVHIWFIERNL
ncbi:MAG: hypothetical protein ACW99Q_21725 [Candidatus Kariarchaeaceae archaeon]